MGAGSAAWNRVCISHSAAESVARIRSEHVCAHECHEVMATFWLEFGFGLGFGFGCGFGFGFGSGRLPPR